MATKRKTRGDTGSSAGRAITWLLTRIVLPLAILYGLLWWRVDSVLDDQIAQARPYFDVRRGTTLVKPNGDVGFSRLVMTPKAGSPFPAMTLRADQVLLQTPGLLWLAKASVVGVPEAIPSRFGVRLTGLQVDQGASLRRAGLSSGQVLFPFDLAGCEATMSDELANELGLDRASTDFEVTMTHDGGTAMAMDFDATLARLARTNGGARFTLGPDGPTSMRLATASLESMNVAFEDLGFVALRNDYCARKLGVEPAAFVASHVQAARDSFAAQGAVPGAAATQAYTSFSKDGGKLAVNVRPLRRGPIAQLQGATSENFSLYYDATVSYGDAFSAPLTFVAAERVAPTVDPSAPAGATPGPAAPSAAPTGTPVAAGAAPAVQIQPGEEIPYDELPSYIGSQIEVETSLGSVRRGELTGASSVSLVVKLVPDDGGFAMSLPKYNVVRVRLAATQTPNPDL